MKDGLASFAPVVSASATDAYAMRIRGTGRLGGQAMDRPFKTHAPVVQWIECKIADLVIQVRLLAGALILKGFS